MACFCFYRVFLADDVMYWLVLACTSFLDECQVVLACVGYGACVGLHSLVFACIVLYRLV